MKKKNKNICICLSHNYPSFDKYFALSLIKMNNYFYTWERKAKRNDTLSLLVQGGYQLDTMRNEVTRAGILADADYILYLDTDMSFPDETVVKMLMVLEQNEKYGYEAVTGIYTYKKPPYMPMIMDAWNEKTHSFSSIGGGFPLDQPFEIAAAGGGILMVETKVLKRKEEPWFKFVKEGEDEGCRNGIGEDLFFFWKFRPKTLCDPTLICGHYDTRPVSLSNYIKHNKLKVDGKVIKVGKKKLEKIKDSHVHKKEKAKIDKQDN